MVLKVGGIILAILVFTQFMAIISRESVREREEIGNCVSKYHAECKKVFVNGNWVMIPLDKKP